MIRDVLFACIAAQLVTGCAPSPAASEPQGRVLEVDQVAGFWRLQAGAVSCDLSLGNLLVDGVRPVLIENCRTPEVAQAKSWRATSDGFELVSADSRALMAFRRTGEDAFETRDRRFRLTRAPLS